MQAFIDVNERMELFSGFSGDFHRKFTELGHSLTFYQAKRGALLIGE
jgi:hypothetical protein